MGNLRYDFARLRTGFFLSGIRDRYVRQRRIPPPVLVVWDCSRRCNLHCAHCGASKEHYGRELTTEQISGLIDELARMRVRMLAATGGEPLLRKDLLEVLAYAHKRGLRTGIATNGFLIDDAAARRIREARVYSVQVSLDGLEGTHNAIRNHADSFSRAVRGIERLIRQRIPMVSVATTALPQNIHELAGMRRLLVDLGVKLWRLAVVMPIGRAEAAGIALDGRQLASLLEFVRDSNREGLRTYIGENLTFLGEWEKRVRDEPLICPIGFTACCIGVDGHVRGCPEQPDTAENREGSVLEVPFGQIWQRGFGRYRTGEVLVTDEDCSACEDNDSCRGGCWVMRENGSHCIRRWLA